MPKTIALSSSAHCCHSQPQQGVSFALAVSDILLPPLLLTYAAAAGCTHRAEVLAHIGTCLVSTPASLGDPTKDTPEELEERHERVLTASLSAAAALLTTMQQAATCQGAAAAGSSSGAEPAAAAAAGTAAALEEVQEKVSGMLTAPGFFKQKLGSKSSVVRRAAYSFIQAVSGAAPQLLQPSPATAAPAVMGALQVRGGVAGGQERGVPCLGLIGGSERRLSLPGCVLLLCASHRPRLRPPTFAQNYPC